MAIAQKAIQNLLLAGLSEPDFALIAPFLQPIELPLRKVLHSRGREIEHVYFLDSGIGSLLASSSSNHTIEIGIVGREGMIGISLVMGARTSPFEAFMQSAGRGWRIAAEDLLHVLDLSADLRTRLLLYGHVLFTQMGYTALSDGRYRLDERLARWLLMALDRSDGNTVHLTHEFLSLMLGVRRPGITTAINKYEAKGVIETARGMLTILDRPALDQAANGSYGAPEAEFERYLGKRAVPPSRPTRQ